MPQEKKKRNIYYFIDLLFVSYIFCIDYKDKGQKTVISAP